LDMADESDGDSSHAATEFTDLSTANTEQDTPIPQPEWARKVFRVTSYNLNCGLNLDGVGASARSQRVLQHLKESKADTFLLQETHKGWQEFLLNHFIPTHPHHSFHHHPSAGGLAVLSRFPFKAKLIEPTAKNSLFPWLLVDMKLDSGDHVQLVNVHLRPPVDDNSVGDVVPSGFSLARRLVAGVRTAVSSGSVRLAEVESITGALNLEKPTVIAGDFNEENGLAIQHIEQLGLREGRAEWVPGEPTWRWQLGGVCVSRALDHCWYTPHSLRCSSSQVLGLNARPASDHLPVVACFQLLEPAMAPHAAGPFPTLWHPAD